MPPASVTAVGGSTTDETPATGYIDWNVGALVTTSFTFPSAEAADYEYAFAGSVQDLQLNVLACDNGQPYNYAASAYVDLTMNLYSASSKLLQSAATSLLNYGYTTFSGGSGTLDGCDIVDYAPYGSTNAYNISIENSYPFTSGDKYTVSMLLTFNETSAKNLQAAAPGSAFICDCIYNIEEVYSPGAIYFNYVEYEYETPST